MKKHIIYSFLILSSFGVSNAQQNNIPIDSIYILSELSRDDTKYSPEQRLAFAQRSYDLAKRTKVDSTILWSNIRLAGVYFSLEKYDIYMNMNHENLKTSEYLKDKKAIATCTFNLGSYYNYQGQIDNAYFYLLKSLKYNEYTKPEEKHQVYLYLASLQYDLKFYLKSELNTIKALNYLNQIPETEESLDDKWMLHNQMGILLNVQGYNKEALKYHKNSILISKKMISNAFSQGEINQLITFNNIAEIYRNKKDYEKALEYYNKIKKRRQFMKYDPSLYPLLIESIAYTKFLNGSENLRAIISDLKKAYTMCDNLPENSDKISTKLWTALDLAEVYSSEQQNDSAYKYAKETLKLSKSIKNNKYLLKSLLLLSDLEQGNTGKAYLKEYISLSDSINKEERNMRNRFARIEYESDQLEADNEKLANEKKWLYAIASGLLLLVLLTYIILMQRSKNRALKFSKAQQKANEDIYKLMLAQQQKLEEGRLQERERVSEELHDGILSKLFGTRLGLSFLELDGDTKELKKFSGYLEQMNVLEKDVRNLSHDLKTNELSSLNDFNAIIKQLLDQQKELHDFQYKLKESKLINWKAINDNIKVNLYRIIQEALHNIVKHAESKTVEIKFKSDNENLELTIRDHGKGFNPKKVKKGIGLKNIYSRINKIKGTIFVDSYLGKGTAIKISIPIPNYD